MGETRFRLLLAFIGPPAFCDIAKAYNLRVDARLGEDIGPFWKPYAGLEFGPSTPQGIKMTVRTTTLHYDVDISFLFMSSNNWETTMRSNCAQFLGV